MRRSSFTKIIAGLICAMVTFSVASPLQVAASSLSTTTLVTGGKHDEGIESDVIVQEAGVISYDGRMVVYTSNSPELVPDDTNDVADIFTYNRITHKTERITIGNDGTQANDQSYGATISADGRYVAFNTRATNMTSDVSDAHCLDTPCANTFVRDLQTNRNTLVSLNTQGSQVHLAHETSPIISGDGRVVAFISQNSIGPNDTNDVNDILVRDLKTRTTRLASLDNNGYTGHNSSMGQSISANGRYVSFQSANALVPGDDNARDDIFVRDMQTNHTIRASVEAYGNDKWGYSQDGSLSADGRTIAFESMSDKLVPNDTNKARDIFARDLQTGKTRRVSVSSHGQQGYDWSDSPTVSADGRYIAFQSYSTNLVASDTNDEADVFINYRDYGLTRRVNLRSHNGAPAVGGSSILPAMSADGKAIVFSSTATNLHSTPIHLFWDNLYVNYNPVVGIPYYDSNDFLDLF